MSLQLLHVLSDRFCEVLGPEGPAAGQGAPFARDVVGFDVRFNGVTVADFKRGDVGRGVEEEGLTVASVLRVRC